MGNLSDPWWRRCSCVVEPFINKRIYWRPTLCKTVLVHGSPASFPGIPTCYLPFTLGSVLSGPWEVGDRHSKSLETVNRILTIMFHQTDPVPGPLPDRDLAAPYPLEQLGTGHCYPCVDPLTNPSRAPQKPPPEGPHMVVSQKMYVNSQTAMKSL